jgi:hypothetical protein
MLLLTHVWQCDLWPLCFHGVHFTPVIISCYEGRKYATLLFPSAFISETPAVRKLLHVMMLKHVSRVKRKHKTRNLQECLCPAVFHHENVYLLYEGKPFFFAQLSSFICSSNYILFFLFGATAPSGPGPPHSRSF